MKFELLPLLDLMIEFYNNPPEPRRFKEYLDMLLNEDGTDMDLPISNYNPMAKDHMLEKLEALRDLQAEQLTADAIAQVNQKLESETELSDIDSTIRVGLAVADDVLGGWTNRYTTDHQSKFELGALLKRSFCSPTLWASERYEKETIANCVEEYIWRSVYQLIHDTPKTLQDHVLQEAFARNQSGQIPKEPTAEEKQSLQDLYTQYKDTTDYPLIFTFLYGDGAAHELGYTEIGASPFMGFAFSQFLAQTKT